MLQGDVHRVFAPGKIYFIKRLDKHKGRAKYGNTVHVCALCESDDAVPPPDHDHEGHTAADVAEASAPTCERVAAAAAATAATAAVGDAAATETATGIKAAAGSSGAAAKDGSSKDQGEKKQEEKEFYPGAKFELIEAEPKQRFQRIVLRETCLLDHLTGGYVQGLKYALEQAKRQKA